MFYIFSCDFIMRFDSIYLIVKFLIEEKNYKNPLFTISLYSKIETCFLLFVYFVILIFITVLYFSNLF